MLNLEHPTEDAQLSYTKVMNTSKRKKRPQQHIGFAFHLCQSVLRKINEVGLKKAYTTTPSLALALKMVPAADFFTSAAG